MVPGEREDEEPLQATVWNAVEHAQVTECPLSELPDMCRNSRSSLDSGRSPPEFRVTETRNSRFRWIPGSGSWSPVDSGIRVLESGGIPGLEFCHLMAFQSRVWSPVDCGSGALESG